MGANSKSKYTIRRACANQETRATWNAGTSLGQEGGERSCILGLIFLYLEMFIDVRILPYQVMSINGNFTRRNSLCYMSDGKRNKARS